MRYPRNAALLALPMVAALVLAGCGGGGAGSGDDSVSFYNTEPENPLLPGDTNENGGSNVVDLMWTGLYSYNPDTGKPVPQMADSVQKTSPTTYDIKIKKGWKFHDGTEVKAKNFVDSWNYTAYAPNAMVDANYLHAIKGYEDVHPEDEKAKPKTDKMSGLQVKGDYEFAVTLSAPFSTFDKQLGYEAFFPMPDQFFKAPDKEKWADHPIGNGPMKFVERRPNTYIKMTRNDAYQGSNKVKFKNVESRIYSTAEAGYQDLVSGNLDFDDTLPPLALADGKYKQDLKGRNAQKNSMTFGYLGLPQYVPQYRDPNLRKALSLAIDREQIAKQIFHGTRTPADGWVPPVMDGAQPGACGELCKYDPAKAKEFLAKSGYKGEISISSNADGGNKEWIEAACGSITKTLGLKCRLDMQTSFGQFNQVVRAKKNPGAFRGTWVADYPTVENFLTQLYGTGGSANKFDYSNPAFDKKLAEAAAAPDSDTGNKLYSDAEKMLKNDMPVIPLFFYNVPYGWSDKLSKGSFSLFNKPYVPGFEPAKH
ncbi:peptide ABC transporter substrate-binding protein [Sciscionella sediminilitoris]|uniref:peptide ABC transporter substrate-binding protein n=1 Tax=Sciscionella sediminilitoris TaxID=1445613 RepID=UPI000564436A|nr:ABC transporter substrate-binding protein [Sciscionella sp. SE31]